MESKDKNKPGTTTLLQFNTDPSAELTTSVYTQLNVQEKIVEITKSSNKIVNDLAKLLMHTHVAKSNVIKPMLDIEKLTLATLHKQILYHQHFIDQLMIKLDSSGNTDVGMFFSISELASRTSNLLTQLTIYIRTLPNHLLRLNNELTDVLQSEDAAMLEGGNQYLGTTATKSDEALIEKLDKLGADVLKQHKQILNDDLTDDLEFNVDDIDDDDA